MSDIRYRTMTELLDEAFEATKKKYKTLPTKIEFAHELKLSMVERINEYNATTDVVRYPIPDDMPWYLVAKIICTYFRFTFGRKVHIDYPVTGDESTKDLAFEVAMEHIHDMAREFAPGLSAADMDSIACYVYDVSEKQD